MIRASIATIPRREDRLRKTVASLLPQVDKLCVYLNDYNEVPGWLQEAGVEIESSHNQFGGEAKFWWATRNPQNDGWEFTCDDDIIYPPDYVTRMREMIDRRGRKVVAAVHGSILMPQYKTYADGSSRKVHHFAHSSEERRVHVAGTGTTAFHSTALKLSEEDVLLHKNKDDLTFSAMCESKRVPIWTPSRAAGWLKAQPTDDGSVYAQLVRTPEHVDAFIKQWKPWSRTPLR